MRWPWLAREKHAAQLPRDVPKPKKGGYAVQNLHGINRPRADRTIEGNEAIYAAVSRIANTVASIPLHLYRGYELATDHYLERLISLEPSPTFSAFVWRQTMEVLRNTEGNAYALKVLDGKLGTVKRLDIINPTRVMPMRDPATGEVWYQIMMDEVGPVLCPGCLVINLRHMSANGLRGIRPLDVLRQTLDYDKQVKELALDQLDGVNHGIILTVPNSGLDQEHKDALVDSFLETYEKSGRSVVILEGGLTANSFSVPPVDAQLLDVERITRNRVATVYNLPPHLLGDYTDTSFSTAEQQMMEFLQLTIIPIVEQWEEELDRKLLTAQDYVAGYRFRFDTTQLTRADVATTAQTQQMAIRGGWRKPNEVRASEYLPPDPSGDSLMFSRDLLPAEIIMQHPEWLLGVKTETTNKDGGDQ